MLRLPPTTEVKRVLPKAQLFKRFDWTASQRERFDAEVSRLDFVNWISPHTVPAIAVGDEVKEIFVVEVFLKSRDFDTKAITLLAKHIPQRIVYVLRYEEMAKLLPTHLVIRDASAANDNVLDNFDQIIESYSNEKKITTHIL